MSLRATILSMLRLEASPCLGARICVAVSFLASNAGQLGNFGHLTYHRYHYGA